MLTIILLLTSVSFVVSEPGGSLYFGPKTPSIVFKGQITENGRPVPALLSLEVLYKLNGNMMPLSLVQVNSLPNYEVHLSGLALKNENITNSVILRVQSLSINGGSRAVKLHLKDGKRLYEQNIELNSRHLFQGNSNNLDLDDLLQNIPIRSHQHKHHHEINHHLQQHQPQDFSDIQLIKRHPFVKHRYPHLINHVSIEGRRLPGADHH